MKHFFCILYLLLLGTYSMAQGETIYSVAEQMPVPEGGYEAFYQFIEKEVKYPSLAIENKTEGRVFLQFVIGKDGSVSDIKIVRPIGDGCDEEAIRLLQMAPKWKAGIQNGSPVKVKMICPIYFRLPQ